MVFFTIDDICPTKRKQIESQLSAITLNPTAYLNALSSNPHQSSSNHSSMCQNHVSRRHAISTHETVDPDIIKAVTGYPIIGNAEMKCINFVPLLKILQMMENVQYRRYTSISPLGKKRRINKKKWKETRIMSTFHDRIYSAPIYDKMRRSFADALVKYNSPLINICQIFESIRENLL